MTDAAIPADQRLDAPQTTYLYREKFNPKNVNGKSVLMKMGKKETDPDYLQVPYRIQWLNHDAPMVDYTSFTLDIDDIQFYTFVGASGKEVRGCWVKVTACLYDEHGRLLKRSSDVGSETHTDFADYIEKAVTKAKGRALASIGFGTQFAVADFDAGEKPSPIDGQLGPALADAPVRGGLPASAAPLGAPAAPRPAPAAPAPAARPAAPAAPAPANASLTPALPQDYNRAAILGWLQPRAQTPAIAQILSSAVVNNLGHLPENERRVSNLSDEVLWQVFEACKPHAA